jgi:predicted deacetylase
MRDVLSLLRRAKTHVSIHDVSPAATAEVEEALTACEEVGATAALLVVPNFHGKWPLDRYPAFVGRLRALQDAGHEIHLHGFFHQAEGPVRTARAFFAQRVASAGEAEFALLDRSEAEERLDRGLAMFDSLGLRPSGFVAPAWQMPRSLLVSLAERKLGYAEDHVRVYDPVARTSRPSLVLNFASRTPGRVWSSAAFVRLALPMRGVLPTRFAIHPGDLRNAMLAGEMRRVLRAARGTFTASCRELMLDRLT